MEDYLNEYKKLVQSLDSFIPAKGVTAKRKGYKFPEADIHTREVIIVCMPEFIVYEHYGTWFLKVGIK